MTDSFDLSLRNPAIIISQLVIFGLYSDQAVLLLGKKNYMVLGRR